MKQTSHKKNLINECHWEITKACNLSCLHCISSTKTKHHLPPHKALFVINKLHELGCKELYLTGGEPLARKDIFDVLKLAKAKKIKTSILTNGTLINRKNIKKIKAFIDEIGISLDGSSPQINDQIRGTGTFKKIIKGILITKENKIPLTLYITLNNINLKDFEDILKLTKKLGINNLRINEITLRGKAYENRKKLKIVNRKNINLEKQLLAALKINRKKVIQRNECDVKPTTIFLSPTGYIYPCIEIYQRRPPRHFGNILKVKPNNITEFTNLFLSAKKKKCPYHFHISPRSSICLNNQSIKCQIT